MNYRTILVRLDTNRQARRRLDVAVRLATAHGAQLVGPYSVFVAEPHSFSGGADDLLEQQQREASRDELAREFANGGAFRIRNLKYACCRKFPGPTGLARIMLSARSLDR